ncbi:MAG: C1 family peptidase [Burkholderiales bacterium]|nr:C1 family peptidase [Burkholderiales bacterium]
MAAMFALASGPTSSQRPTGLILDPTYAPPLNSIERISPKALPLALDNRRYFDAVKDQQQCGSCTVFSGTALLESALVRDGRLFVGTERLSEQLTIDCLAAIHPTMCKDGAYIDTALASLRDYGTTSKAIPYVAGWTGTNYVSSFNACVTNINSTTSANYAYRVTDYAKIGAKSVDDIKQAINTYGAVVTSLYVTQTFGSYGSTSADIVMQPCQTKDACGWHAVVLLGWDDGRQAFLGRNSWGASWGTAGYFFISYGEVSRYSVSQLAVRENGIYVARTTSLPFNYLAPPDPSKRVLSVAKSGDGAGVVSSSLGGISCGSDCDANFIVNSVIDLTAVSNANSDFGGWLGNCAAGTPVNVCRVKLSESNVVFASFSAKPTGALDPHIVGVVGADFATRFAATPRIESVNVMPGYSASSEITRVDRLNIGAASPTLVLDRWITVSGRYDRELHRDQFTMVYAKQLVLDPALKGKTVTFAHKPVAAGTLDGLNGAIGANGANGVGEVGRDGMPGIPGQQGGKGQDGRSLQYPQVVLAFEQIVWSDGATVQPGTVNFRLDFEGIRGGAGGNGGRGGNGGNGAQGKQGATGLFACLEGPGSSGKGGDGGVGGLPGVGGDGGDGADVFAFSAFDQQSLFLGASVFVSGGAGGGGGQGGGAGSPGAGGPAAPSNGWCGGGRAGPAGSTPNANLGVGSAGAAGRVGSYVSYVLRQTSAAKAVEPPVIEYTNTLDFPKDPGGHFFYTSSADEQKFLDSGGAGHFVRTGRSFNAGGSKQVCRFYGSVSPGPNSHFFSIRDSDCLLLRSLQVVPTPTNIQQWNFEGLGFSVTPPIASFDGTPVGCGSSLVPVYLYYNNAFHGAIRNPWDSNHRYGTDKAALDAFADTNGWSKEGIAFCARP